MSFRSFIIFLLIFSLVISVGAQTTTPQVAFVNNSGQLIVVRADGLNRWIVTNPGEYLQSTIGFNWSPNGNRLLFAVEQGNVVHLRIGDATNQIITEIAQLQGTVSGGRWLDNNTLQFAENNQLIQVDIQGNAESIATLPTTIILQSHGSTLDDHIFFWQNGQNGILDVNTPDNSHSLELSNVQDARNNGIWNADNLIAYWGFANNGTSSLAVTNVNNDATITLNLNQSAPLTPLTWIDNSSQLVYRADTIRITDVNCLRNTCNNNPFEEGISILPLTATDVQVSNNWIYSQNGRTIQAVNLECVANNSCLNNAITIAENVAPRTTFSLVDNRLIYTAFTQNANDNNDREIRILDIDCVNTVSCQAQSILSSSVAGELSADGEYVIADILGTGLSLIELDTRNVTVISNSMGQLGTGLDGIRWNQ